MSKHFKSKYSGIIPGHSFIYVLIEEDPIDGYNLIPDYNELTTEESVKTWVSQKPKTRSYKRLVSEEQISDIF